MMNNLPLYGNNLTYRFVDVYTDVDSFIADYKNLNTEFPNKIPAKTANVTPGIARITQPIIVITI